jgi:hypothetical protein
LESTPAPEPQSPADDAAPIDEQPTPPASPAESPPAAQTPTAPDEARAVPDPAPTAPVAPAGPAAVVVDQYTRRSDADVLLGHFGRIEDGEHAGKVGVFEAVASTGVDGYPDTVRVKLRESGEVVVCAYASLTPAAFGGR